MTSLTTWKPVRDLFDIRNDMSRVFDDLFRPVRYRPRNGSWDWLPAVDILEADDRVEIRAEVPGLSEKEVQVSVTDSVLTLKGEKTHEKQEKENKYHRVERNYGRFQRSFTLPANLNAEAIKATFKNGILTLSVPKMEQAKPKEIPINVQ